MEIRVANENLVKLKELSDKLSVYETDRSINENVYKVIVNEIKEVIENEYNDYDSDERIVIAQKRICEKIKFILNKFKIN